MGAKAEGHEKKSGLDSSQFGLDVSQEYFDYRFTVRKQRREEHSETYQESYPLCGS
jgi:hypothetical protein